jgi:hypothetical protein
MIVIYVEKTATETQMKAVRAFLKEEGGTFRVCRADYTYAGGKESIRKIQILAGVTHALNSTR